jgi:hypothetical protein
MQVNFVEGIPDTGLGRYLFVLTDGSIYEAEYYLNDGRIVILKPTYEDDQDCENITDLVAGYLDLDLYENLAVSSRYAKVYK